MAAPVARNINIYRGDDYAHVFTLVDADGTPLDLSGLTFTAQLRTDADAQTAIDFAVDDTDAATGVIVISLTPEQTTALSRDVYRYDVQSSASETFVYGSVKVTKDITHA